MARWRLVRKQRAQGPYFVVQKGRGGERVGLALGYVPEGDATRALETIQAEEDAESVGRVLRLYRRDRAEAIQYLLGDPEVARQVGPPEPDHGSMRLEEYFEAVYKAWRMEHRPRGWPQESRHWKILLAGIGSVRLRQIDEFVLADHLDGLTVTRGRRKGQPASGNTKRLQRAALQALLKRAYRLQHISRRPDLAEFRIDGASTPVTVKPDPLTLDELADLMSVSQPKHRAMWAVGAGQGLRPSELIRVHWEDVDLEVRTLRVRGTKTLASAATVPLTPLAHRELLRWWERCGQPTEGLAFPSRTGDQYSPQGWRKALATAVEAAGIERHIHPYLLRDSFATIAWSVGMEMEVTRRVGRWTDEKMLQQVYCRPRPAELVVRVASFDLDA